LERPRAPPGSKPRLDHHIGIEKDLRNLLVLTPGAWSNGRAAELGMTIIIALVTLVVMLLLLSEIDTLWIILGAPVISLSASVL
jgi:hypothetical protein